jgi:hypothetical protein
MRWSTGFRPCHQQSRSLTRPASVAIKARRQAARCAHLIDHARQVVFDGFFADCKGARRFPCLRRDNERQHFAFARSEPEWPVGRRGIRRQRAHGFHQICNQSLVEPAPPTSTARMHSKRAAHRWAVHRRVGAHHCPKVQSSLNRRRRWIRTRATGW